MRRYLIGLVSLLFTVVALAAGGTSYSLDIDIAPTAQAGAYACKAVVKDLETGKVVVAPNIALLADTPAAITSRDGDLVAEFRVSVESKASRAIAELKVSRGGRVVASQKSSVAVR